MLKETSRHFSCSVFHFCSHIFSHVLQFLLGVGLLTFYSFKIKLIQIEIFFYVYKNKERKHLHAAIKEKACSQFMLECFII